MHLCYILPPIEFYSPISGGAIATLTMQQGRRLQAHQHQITVLAPQNQDPIYPVGHYVPLKGVTRDEIAVWRRALSSKIMRPLMHYDWLYFEHYAEALRRELQKIKPEAVLCFNDWQTPLLVKRWSPQTRVFLRLSNECTTRMHAPQEAIAACEMIFGASGYIRDWAQQHFDIPDEKIQVLPNGCDPDTFFPAEDYRERIMSPKSTVHTLFLSRIDPNKGPDIAADAVAMLRQEKNPVELTMAGGKWFYNHEEDLKDPFVAKVKAKAEAAVATYRGHVTREKVPQLWRDNDVCLLPVRQPDPMPQVVFEAMASGCAVISSPLGGIPEACGDAAIWLDTPDATSTANALRRLVQDRDVLLEYKERALNRARQMTWDHNTQRIERVLLRQ